MVLICITVVRFAYSLEQGAEAAVPRSKYDEDVMRFNHTCVWGSWWEKEGRLWGYACCLSTNRNT